MHVELKVDPKKIVDHMGRLWHPVLDEPDLRKLRYLKRPVSLVTKIPLDLAWHLGLGMIQKHMLDSERSKHRVRDIEAS